MTLRNSYTPQIVDRLDIVSATSIDVGDLNLTSDTAGFEFVVSPTRVSLFFLDNASGGYNGNGSVDAADYTVWRDTF